MFFVPARDEVSGYEWKHSLLASVNSVMYICNMYGLCMRHVPIELRTDIQEVDIWFVPVDIELPEQEEE